MVFPGKDELVGYLIGNTCNRALGFRKERPNEGTYTCVVQADNLTRFPRLNVGVNAVDLVPAGLINHLECETITLANGYIELVFRDSYPRTVNHTE